MRGVFEVKTHEMAAVECHDSTAVRRGKLQHLSVRYGPAGVTGLAHGYGIVTRRRNSATTGAGTFSFGVEPRHRQAASCAETSSSISVGWSCAYAQVLTRSSARSPGYACKSTASEAPRRTLHCNYRPAT